MRSELVVLLERLVLLLDARPRARGPARPRARSASSARSRARVSTPRQMASSSRRPSASRRTFCASRWSAQKSGSRGALVERGQLLLPWRPGQSRPEVAWTRATRSRISAWSIDDGVGVSSVRLQPRARRSWSSSGRSSMILSAVLLRATTGFTQGQYPLCGHSPAVAVAVEPGGVAAGAAIALTGDQVGERLDRRIRPQPPPVTASRSLSPSAAPRPHAIAGPGPV